MLRPPIRRKGDAFVVRLGDDENELLSRLLAELRALLTTDDPAAVALTGRLFPAAFPDDPEREAEYQRLMRDELVASRLASIDTVEALLGDELSSGDGRLDEDQLTALMRSINSLRLVLGTMLGIRGDDPDEGHEGHEGDAGDDPDAVDPRLVGSPEHHLYGYLSWLLEHAVRALSGR